MPTTPTSMTPATVVNASTPATSSTQIFEPSRTTESPNWDAENDLPTVKELLQQMSPNKKPQCSAQRLMIIIATSSGEQKTYKLRDDTPLKKMLTSFAVSYGKEMSSFMFVYEGRRINPEQTPRMYDMEDDDVIDAMIEQIGGFVENIMTGMNVAMYHT
ncbi:hypothetical protein IW261DRAFT_1573721 [Armillaria novae-zelandiae]|uniref:Ubiquitin-like domain-containing protein n=1 Tax=Armillaria novae-zelandiae TaxID=153914 RepID=A0AA39NMW8_9AGAR|nr:hypothetical protein IW261DRAFT_1573721 [Armillaria novae-zelandiae]